MECSGKDHQKIDGGWGWIVQSSLQSVSTWMTTWHPYSWKFLVLMESPSSQHDVLNLPGLAMIFSAGQFLSVRSLFITNDDLCRAFCMWHRPICKNLDWVSSELSPHHLLHRAVSTRLNKVETAVDGCNSWFSVWTLSWGVVPLRSINLASLFSCIIFCRSVRISIACSTFDIYIILAFTTT